MRKICARAPADKCCFAQTASQKIAYASGVRYLPCPKNMVLFSHFNAILSDFYATGMLRQQLLNSKFKLITLRRSGS